MIKVLKKICYVIVIFCCCFFVIANFFIIIKNDLNVKNNAFCLKNNNCNLKHEKIFINVKGDKINLFGYKSDNLTSVQNDFIEQGISCRVKTLEFALNNGFNLEQGINYTFPELNQFLSDIENRFCYEPKTAKIKAKLNTGEVYIQDGEDGVKINKNAFYNDFFKNITSFDKIFNTNLQFLNIINEKTKEYFLDKIFLRGSFKTSFYNSSESRKNNIKTALKSLDGVIIEPGEIFSFNNTTGERNKENGYQKAKTIKNGSFYEEFGGGVCQVSSTLYNAFLLSDVEIIEVHPHSLPVSYVEPCFDAMVNMGSSDLRIKNNTKEPIIIACSDKNDECLINVYGLRNDFEIKKVSKKTGDILDFETEIIRDYRLVGLDKPMNKGESKVISNGKPGYKAIGYLEYYKDGVLVKTKDIRSDTYKSTKEVILIG